MNAVPHVFGKYDHLVGVVEYPSLSQLPMPSEVGVILVTPGMLSSSGPFRMHVDLARKLAEMGIASLRFDLSGIGESLGVGAEGDSGSRSVDEIRQAIECLRSETSAKRFVLFGLCSGADDSVRAALTIPEVAGLVAIDGLGYPAGAFRWHRLFRHYLPRMMHFEKWRSRIQNLRKPGSVPASMRIGEDIREYPPQEQAAKELRDLAERGVAMHFIYTGGVSAYYNHAGQFFEMFPHLRDHEKVTSEFFPDFDHVAYLWEDRVEMIEHIGHQICEMAGGPPIAFDQAIFAHS